MGEEEEASSMWGVVRSLGVLRNGEVRLKMEKGEDFRDGAEIRPEKSSGDSASLSFSRGFLATVTEGLGMGLPPKIPSSSEAALEAEEPSGEEVGGGEEITEEEGDEVRERTEMEVLGERPTLPTPASWGSRGSTETPGSSRLDMSIGLKILFLLLAR